MLPSLKMEYFTLTNLVLIAHHASTSRSAAQSPYSYGTHLHVPRNTSRLLQAILQNRDIVDP